MSSSLGLTTLTAMLTARENAAHDRDFTQDNVLGRRTLKRRADYDEAARMTEESAGGNDAERIDG